MSDDPADVPPDRADRADPGRGTRRRSAGSRRRGRMRSGPGTRCTRSGCAGRKTYLFAFIDDHSRAVMAARFGFAEDAIRLAAALRPALASRGVPAHAYVDNGSAFVDAWLLRACAKLGIKLIHSQPGRPAGQGKDRTIFQDCAGPVPGRAYRGARRPDRGPGGAEQAVHRLDRDGLPRPGAFGDRAAAAGPVGSRRPVPAPAPDRTWLRRSAGPNGGPSPRRPWSPCTATTTRSTRRWPAGASSWSSTRST